MMGYLNQSFPGGFFGIGNGFQLPNIDFGHLDLGSLDLDPRGDVVRRDIPSPALALDGGAAPLRSVIVYRPPAFFHSDENFPVVYFLGGYGQKPSDFIRVTDLLDLL